jgi:hypothetical protein
MKKYKAMKAAGKWSVRKYGDRLQLVRKSYDKNTGEQVLDIAQDYSLDSIASRITQITTQITELTSEKADWEELEKDLKAL